MIRSFYAMLAALPVVLAGCGGNGTYPVEGKVVYQDGVPATDLAGYLVNLDLPDQQVGASGLVQPDGTFTIGTFEDDDGALPGKYRVAITPPEPPVDAPPPKPIIPRTYGDLQKSGLEMEVKPEDNDITLTVQRLK